MNVNDISHEDVWVKEGVVLSLPMYERENSIEVYSGIVILNQQRFRVFKRDGDPWYEPTNKSRSNFVSRYKRHYGIEDQ